MSPFRESQQSARLSSSVLPGARMRAEARTHFIQLSLSPREILNFEIEVKRLKQKKEDRITFRVSPEELKRIEDAADSAYMTPAAYARSCALRQKIQVVPGLEDAVHQLKKIGANLNQLTVLAHEGQITAVKLDETNEAVQSLFYPLIEIMEEVKR